MRRHNIASVWSAFAALLLSACGGPLLYKADLPHNLTIKPTTESVTTSLAIYRVDRDCKTTYQGSVDLDNKQVELGIATGKPAYLVVNFTSSSFWRASTGSISSATVLLPREGFRYLIDVNYVNGIYNVNYYEVERKTNKRRELEMVGLSNCRNN